MRERSVATALEVGVVRAIWSYATAESLPAGRTNDAEIGLEDDGTPSDTSLLKASISPLVTARRCGTIESNDASRLNEVLPPRAK
jgi:hypothetical protein